MVTLSSEEYVQVKNAASGVQSSRLQAIINYYQPKYSCYHMSTEIWRTVHNHVVTVLVDEENAISSNPFSQFTSLSGTAGSQTHLEGVCCQDKGMETGRGSAFRYVGLFQYM